MDSDSQLRGSINLANRETHVNYISFNQDASLIALGLSDGFRVFTCKKQIKEQFFYKRYESIGIVELLFNTSLVALVGLGEDPGSLPRKLRIVNANRKTTLCELIFPSTILLVKMSLERMVVLLEELIFVYDISNMSLLHTIETSPNNNRLFTLSHKSSKNGKSLLAYPSPPRTVTHDSLLVNGINTNGGSNSAQNNIQSVSSAPNRVGDAIIFDLHSLQPLAVIEAHKSALSAMCLSSDGQLLATASEKGTIVRIFNVETGLKLYQFRRGTYPTTIHSLSFSESKNYVVATSASGTVHIFRLGENELLANKQKRKKESFRNRNQRKSLYQTIQEESEETFPVNEAPNSSHRRDSPIGSKYSDNTIESGRNHLDESTGISNEDAIGENDEGDEGDVDEVIEDDGDDSDAEAVEVDEAESDADDDDNDDDDDDDDETSRNLRTMSRGSHGSLHSLTSTNSIMSGADDAKEKVEPIVDQNRLSVARLIRRSSQNLGRKAAQKMGDFLPSRFSSILEPTRHFASLKISTLLKEVKSIAFLDDEIHSEEMSVAKLGRELSDNVHFNSNSPTDFASPLEIQQLELLHVHVLTSEGSLYVYGLDPERGGDCILLKHHQLLND